MKKIFIFLIFLATLLSAEVVTKTVTKKAQGEGYGTSYEEALDKALVDAVGRLYGGNLNSKSSFTINSIKTDKKRDYKKEYNDKIKKSTNGRYDSYDVVSKIKTQDGYKVKVLIKKSRTTKRYKTPGLNPNNRRKIAVISAYSGKRGFEIFQNVYSYKKVTFSLTQEIINQITQSRKFTILDRDANEAYEEEKSIILSNGNKDEALKLGKVLGADYLLVSSVSEYNLQKNIKKQDITGVIKNQVIVKATIQYRIIAMATRQIKYSNTKNFNFHVEGDSDEEYFLNSLKTIAKNITDDILENIYPIKIAQQSGLNVILSQKLTIGEKYSVYTLGKKIKDSYTKEFVGREERKVGTIEITRVTPKISYAKVIEGRASKGDICRLISDKKFESNRADVTEKEKPSDVEIINGGGVVLPFDWLKWQFFLPLFIFKKYKKD